MAGISGMAVLAILDDIWTILDAKEEPGHNTFEGLI